METINPITPNQKYPETKLARMKILARLAVGFSAEIWEGECQFGTHPRRAVRITHEPCEHRHEELERLRQIVRMDRFPGLPVYHEIGSWMGKLYASSALAECDCSTLIQSGRVLEGVDLERALQIVTETAATLDFLAEQGFVHGSVCPQHILLCNNRATLTGFSYFGPLKRERITPPIDLMARLCMSPEVANGTVTSASDQYSLAATYLAMRIGASPIGDPSWPQLYVSSLRVHEGIAISKSLAELPNERFSNCVEFANALREGLAKGTGTEAEKGDILNNRVDEP